MVQRGTFRLEVSATSQNKMSRSHTLLANKTSRDAVIGEPWRGKRDSPQFDVKLTAVRSHHGNNARGEGERDTTTKTETANARTPVGNTTDRVRGSLIVIYITDDFFFFLLIVCLSLT